MRIIAGSRARMTLYSPVGMTTRPITDRVKQSLFDILQSMILDTVVADLFCGTGSLGLEALSRGARFAIMADQSRETLGILKENIKKLNFGDCAAPVRTDIFKHGIPDVDHPILVGADGQKMRCNLIFVDPPYRDSEDASATSRLASLLTMLCRQIADQALVVVRHEKHAVLLDRYDRLKMTDARRYGGMTLSFFENQGPETPLSDSETQNGRSES